MQIVVYADDTARPVDKRRSANYEGIIGVSGFMAPKEYWVDFCEQWAKILSDFGVDRFHFRELSKPERGKRENLYYGRDDDWVDNFIYSLAKLISRGQAVPIGSNVFLATPEHKNYRPDTWRQAFDLFFGHFLQMMDIHWAGFKGPAHFFFDRQENPKILAQLNDSIQEYQEKDPRVGRYTPGGLGPKEPPLQAADMIAYAHGQSAERAFVFQSRQRNRILDLLLFRNQFPKGHPNSLPWFINDAAFEDLVDSFRQDKKDFDLRRKSLGLKKTEYFPAIHYGNTIDRTKT